MDNSRLRPTSYSKSRIIPCLMLASCLALSEMGLAAQGTQISPKSFAGSHSVVVIGANRPAFDSVLEADFPGVSQVQYFSAVKPLLAIIHNNTQRVLKAFAVIWTIVSADGAKSTAILTVVSEPGVDEWRLPGARTVLGRAGTGLGIQLISPFFHWARARIGAVLPALGTTFSALSSQQAIVAGAQSAASVSAGLDGAIFGDGVCVGPDTSKLFERFQAAQRARIDEARWVESQLNSGATDQQLRQRLSKQIFAGRNSAGTGAASLYAEARGREAERFLAVLDGDGHAALIAASRALSLAAPLTLTRAGTP
ncbi:MAG: hypothetical protein ACRD2B_15025 [Terriglobia bacterium]